MSYRCVYVRRDGEDEVLEERAVGGLSSAAIQMIKGDLGRKYPDPEFLIGDSADDEVDLEP